MPEYDFLMFIKNPVRSCTGYSLRVCISNGRLKMSPVICVTLIGKSVYANVIWLMGLDMRHHLG